MNRQQTIVALLVAKFGQARKDGLENLARTIASLTDTDDEAKAMVEKLTPDKVKEQETGFRSYVDAETQKAASSREENLKKTYDFTPKGQQQPPTPPTPPTPKGDMSAEAIAKLIQDGISAGLKPYQEKLAAMEAKGVNDARRGRLMEALGNGVPEAYKTAITAAFNAQQFADDAAFETYLQEQQTAAAELSKTISQSRLGYMAVSHSGNNNGGGEGVSAAVQSFVDNSKTGAAQPGAPVGKAI